MTVEMVCLMGKGPCGYKGPKESTGFLTRSMAQKISEIKVASSLKSKLSMACKDDLPKGSWALWVSRVEEVQGFLARFMASKV